MSYYGSLTPTRPAPSAPNARLNGGGPGAGSVNNSLYAGSSYSPNYSSYASGSSSIGFSPSSNASLRSGSSTAVNSSILGSSDGGTVRQGYVSIKEDGFASFLWSRKWLILREHIISFHKNEVCLFINYVTRLLSKLIHISVDCPTELYAPPCRYHQRRSYRLEALLPLNRDKGP